MGTICEYPCRLDLWAEVVKAKKIQREDQLLDRVPKVIRGCGNASAVDDARVQVVSIVPSFVAGNKVRIEICYNIILTILHLDGSYSLQTCTGFTYCKEIPISEFDPPITPQQLRDEVTDTRVVVKNWVIIPEITETTCETTTVVLTVYADVICKLTKFHDVIVYGEYDPDVDP